MEVKAPLRIESTMILAEHEQKDTEQWSLSSQSREGCKRKNRGSNGQSSEREISTEIRDGEICNMSS